MVSHKTDGRLGNAITDEPIKHTLGIGTAVDVIPEKDTNRVWCGMHGYIRINSCKDLVQEVQAPMDIPDGINSGVLGHASARGFNAGTVRRPDHHPLLDARQSFNNLLELKFVRKSVPSRNPRHNRFGSPASG